MLLPLLFCARLRYRTVDGSRRKPGEALAGFRPTLIKFE
jgi:hypothetical protein